MGATSSSPTYIYLRTTYTIQPCCRKVITEEKSIFPTSDGKYHDMRWQEYTFSEIWQRVSRTNARPYDFHSNYAVNNINRWNYDGTD